MKYILLLVVLFAAFVYADFTQTVTGGDYLVGKVGSTERVKYGNQSTAKSAAAKLSEGCTCDVEINQPTIVYRTLVTRSSSSMAVSSKAASSVATSVPAGLIGITFGRPQTNQPIKQYVLTRGKGFAFKNETIQATGSTMNYFTAPPAAGEYLLLSTEYSDGRFSPYEAVAF